MPTTLTAPTLRFPAFGEVTLARWDDVISTRPLSERACALIRICLEAVETTAPAGLQTRWHNGCLWFRCDQSRLGELLSCSDRTIRRELQELQQLGVLAIRKGLSHTEAGPVEITAYAISLDRCEALPAREPTPELDQLIHDCDGQPFADEASTDTFPSPLPRDGRIVALLPVRADTCVDSSPLPRTGGEGQGEGADSDGLSAPVSGGLSAGLSAPLSGGLPVVCRGSVRGVAGGLSASHDHDHERLNELYNPSITHDHDQAHETSAAQPVASRPRPDPVAEPPVRQFHAIDTRDIRAIGGFAIDTPDGRKVCASEASRRRVLQEYFADAVSAGHAEPHELRLFAALFRHVARRGDVKAKPKYLRTCWTNRHNADRPLAETLTAADRSYARDLIPDPVPSQ